MAPVNPASFHHLPPTSGVRSVSATATPETDTPLAMQRGTTPAGPMPPVQLQASASPAATSRDRVNVYQLMVRTFGNVKGANRPDGDLTENGVGKFNDINDAALDGIKALGTTHVWLTGILRQATATSYDELGLPADDPDILKGKAGSLYAVRDFYDVSPDYAVDPERRMEELKALIDRIHAKGMKVVMDFVPNHVARTYDSIVRPEENFGKNDDTSKFFDPDNNYFYLHDQPGRPLHLPKSDHWSLPGADERFPAEDGSPDNPVRMTGNRATYEATSGDWKEVVKLNYGYNPHTGERAFDPIPDTWHKMDRILAYWQELGIDGFRADYAHVVPVEFWKWSVERAKERDPNTFFVAEAYDTAPDKIPGFTLESLLEAGFDAVYDDRLYDGLRDVVLGDKWANDIDAWLEHAPHLDDKFLRYGENHDEPRIAATRRPHSPHHGGLGSPEGGIALGAILHLATRGPNLVYNGQEVGEAAAGVEGFGGDDARTTIFDYWTMPQHARWVGRDHAYDGADLTPEQRQLRRRYEELMTLSRSAPFANGARYNLQWFNRGRSDYDDQHIYSFIKYDEEGHRSLVVVNLSPDATKDARVRVPGHALQTLGLSDDSVLGLSSTFGSAPKASAATGRALREDGVPVELPPFGVSVLAIDEKLPS